MPLAWRPHSTAWARPRGLPAGAGRQCSLADLQHRCWHCEATVWRPCPLAAAQATLPFCRALWRVSGHLTLDTPGCFGVALAMDTASGSALQAHPWLLPHPLAPVAQQSEPGTASVPKRCVPDTSPPAHLLGLQTTQPTVKTPTTSCSSTSERSGREPSRRARPWTALRRYKQGARAAGREQAVRSAQ